MTFGSSHCARLASKHTRGTHYDSAVLELSWCKMVLFIREVKRSYRSLYAVIVWSSYIPAICAESLPYKESPRCSVPNMSADIKQITSECRQCEEDAVTQNKEPQLAHTTIPPNNSHGVKWGLICADAKGKIWWR